MNIFVIWSIIVIWSIHVVVIWSNYDLKYICDLKYNCDLKYISSQNMQKMYKLNINTQVIITLFNIYNIRWDNGTHQKGNSWYIPLCVEVRHCVESVKGKCFLQAETIDFQVEVRTYSQKPLFGKNICLMD